MTAATQPVVCPRCGHSCDPNTQQPDLFSAAEEMQNALARGAEGMQRTLARAGVLDKLAGIGQARTDDPPTAKAAAQVGIGRKTSARHKLLRAFYIEHQHYLDGMTDGAELTDEEAAQLAELSLRSEYATRCSELRREGYIEPMTRTRPGHSGLDRRTSRITPKGVAAIEEVQS